MVREVLVSMRCQTKEELFDALSYQLDNVSGINEKGNKSIAYDYKTTIRNITKINFYDNEGNKHYLFDRRTAIKMVLLKIREDTSHIDYIYRKQNELI